MSMLKMPTTHGYPNPERAVLLPDCSLAPHPLVRKSLSKNLPSSPRRKVDAMMAYLPGGTLIRRLTSRMLMYRSVFAIGSLYFTLFSMSL